jgi:hypothetical protein
MRVIAIFVVSVILNIVIRVIARVAVSTWAARVAVSTLAATALRGVLSWGNGCEN